MFVRSLLLLSLVPLALPAKLVNKQCRELLQCSIKAGCVQLDMLSEKFSKYSANSIDKELYNILDSGVDYGCIFSAGCVDECSRCPLCQSSKEQLVDVLSGNKREEGVECHELVNCASECVAVSSTNITQINHCLRHDCAFHCFDGSCQQCSAFITRVFNQICVSGEFRSKVQGFEGQCYEMFKQIVYAKFKSQFDAVGEQPAIGPKTAAR